MIIGIDHIALSVTDIDKAVDIISGWNYEPRFIEKKLVNDPAKTSYLSTKNRFHDIAYCRSLCGGLSIELTAHDREYSQTKEDSAYKIIFSGRNPGSKSDEAAKEDGYICGIIAQALGDPSHSIYLDGFDTAAYYLDYNVDMKDGYVCARAILSETRNLEESVKFWLGLGFSLKRSTRADADDWRLLEFKNHLSPVGFNLLIRRVDRIRQRACKIDAAGFNCLAFLTSNVNAERRRLDGDGIESTDIFSFCAGDNRLRICLCRGPDGQPVELIEIERRGRR